MSQNQASSPADAKPTTAVSRIVALIPGILLCIAVAGVSALLERAELGVFEHPYVEALVMAILLGMALRTSGSRRRAGRPASPSAPSSCSKSPSCCSGPRSASPRSRPPASLLSASIAAVVVIIAGVSFGLSRLLGLPTRLAILIACGNSICGNSAIAAVAPVIGADSDDVASSIAFTAVLGVLMVLGLPLLIPLLRPSATSTASWPA